MPEIEVTFIRIQMILFNEFLDAVRPHKVVWIIKIDFFDCDLVSCNSVAIIWDANGSPMMTSCDFHVPNFIAVVELNAVSFSGAVFGN